MITAAATATPTLRLVVEPAGYHVGAPVEVTFLLGNAAAAPLWLNRRLAIDSPQAPRFARELWLDFRGPDGRNVEFVTPPPPPAPARPPPRAPGRDCL